MNDFADFFVKTIVERVAKDKVSELFKVVLEDNQTAAEEKLSELFKEMMKKDLTAADRFARCARNAVSEELNRRIKLTDAMHFKMVRNFPDATAHIARDIHTTSRKIGAASKADEVLAALKEIADHIIRHLTFGGNVVETGDLPVEFQVLIDMGANCADFLTEEERTGITQSIRDYVQEVWEAVQA
jgi:DNA-binding transcriptional regulator GbsR (MarR family)